MTTNSRGTNQTSILYLHNPLYFWIKSPAASSSATLRCSSSLAYRRSFVTNMRRPTSAIHVSNLFQQSHPKKGMREIGSHNCHFSWLTQIKQQQVACPSALLPGQDLHLAIEFQRPLPQPFFWLLLVLPALLFKQPTSTLKHLHAVLPQYAVGKADTSLPYMSPYMNTFQRMRAPLSFQGQSVFHQPC